MPKSAIIQQLEQSGLLSRKGKALDLGCGAGNDAIGLARAGYEVIAVDLRAYELAILESRRGKLPVKTIQKDISDFDIEPGAYSLIAARNSLPFLRAEDVWRVIEAMANGLKPNGILFFTLFGTRDDWSNTAGMNFHVYEDVIESLQKMPLRVYFRSNEESYSTTQAGEMKFWQVHTFIYVREPITSAVARDLLIKKH